MEEIITDTTEETIESLPLQIKICGIGTIAAPADAPQEETKGDE